ncbi:hypothetical protein PoB_007480800 [Plakobranchus ocellatus]|uniref:Uncharacterized protein n=1 Tax=Plakobranchus ocellatus TaxID=259542 RepID=A0AAV4DVM4_9GAST|nr:hypothetical protein PoB_007480800 [Plakobranchus ocellatus]
MKGMVVLMMNIKFISIQMIVMMDSLVIPQTNDDTNDEGSHDGLLDDPQRNSDTNDEEVQEGCNVADGQPLLNNDSMNLERLILCLAENENTHIDEELPEKKKNNCFFHN